MAGCGDLPTLWAGLEVPQSRPLRSAAGIHTYTDVKKKKLCKTTRWGFNAFAKVGIMNP